MTMVVGEQPDSPVPDSELDGVRPGSISDVEDDNEFGYEDPDVG